MAMKWADLEEEKFSGCEHGSFESRFWTLSNLCFAKKNEYPMEVVFHGFAYDSPHKDFGHKKTRTWIFTGGASQTDIGEHDCLCDCINNCWRNHCEVTVTYGNLVMYKNYETGEEWFKE